ncbi:MAG: lipid IV(A) 3-deoxy-D-manno-octulosonic acid transferase [Thiothrix sp.]|nr:lipid IV(A) 3-deoxy-D-manno-octulosonic acid transferase [Thiothrix sp.]
MSLARMLYSLCLYLLLPLLLLRLLLRSLKQPEYRRRWRERLGLVPPPDSQDKRPLICLHAVSVGETMAARALVEALLKALPGYQLYLTSTTPTGSATVKRLFDGRVGHAYLPYDLPGAMARLLERVRPQLFLVMETEIWPNLYAACHQRDIALMLVNARLSARSATAYQRVAPLVAETLMHVSVIAARHETDARRFRDLGADPERVRVAGNIKFALQPDPVLVAAGQAFRADSGRRQVWCAGSTHEGEERLLLAVHRSLRRDYPALLLILAPRHPERFEAVAALCREAGLSMVRRSEGMMLQPQTAVLLGDSMCELLMWYAASDMAFFGGSLVPVGGHNPLEASALGLPVLSGPHVHNFADLYPDMMDAGAAALVESSSELEHHLRLWLADPLLAQQQGTAGRVFFERHQDVVGVLVAGVQGLLAS